jgi:ABC-2 type transport system permease protein
MAANNVFQPVDEHGWRTGFANLFRKESRDWWGTRTWLVRTLMWGLILNGLLAMVLFATPPEAGQAAAQAGRVPEAKDVTGLTLFFVIAGLALSIGTIILAQDEIIDEKKQGTAAWILSKPVSRTAFVLSKLLANALSILIVMVLIQGVLAFVQVSIARGSLLPIGSFLGALGLLFLNLMFYLTLVLMLGTLFTKRGGVLGIPLAILLGYQLLVGVAPFTAEIMPWALTMPLGQTAGSSLALALALGQPLPSLTPIIATAVWCVVFTAVAVWRFNRDEF